MSIYSDAYAPDYESRIRELARAVRGDEMVPWSTWPVRYVDTKRKTVSGIVTGRPQGAICVYCDKQLCSWGQMKKNARTSSAGRDAPYSVMAAVDAHSWTCAETWAWMTLSRVAIEIASLEERIAVAEWRVSLGKYARYGTASTARLLRMFERLPSPPGSEIATTIEVSLRSVHLELASWPDGDIPVHGEDARNPHVFLPILSGHNARLAGVEVRTARPRVYPVGMCPCGTIGPVGTKDIKDPS